MWLAEASTRPPSAFRSEQQGYLALKVLALVKRGWHVTVAVGDPAGTDASLLYDPSNVVQNGRYRIDQGDTAVGFSACAGHRTSWASATQLNGGMVVARPICLPLIISGSGPGSFSQTLQIPVGRGAACPSSPTA